ncbi:phospholipase A and acyltransferase 3-like isoform 1-T4 [Pholidichthys leucotaenia]
MASGSGAGKSKSQTPKPGDLIGFWRGLYDHVGVFVGNGMVVHKGPEDGDAAKPGKTQPGLVKKDPLEKVAGKDSWRIYNILDDKYKARPVDDIIKEANDLAGKQQPYNVVNQNCEHFAFFLRYGQKISPQVIQQQKSLNEALLQASADNMFASTYPNSFDFRK